MHADGFADRAMPEPRADRERSDHVSPSQSKGGRSVGRDTETGRRVLRRRLPTVDCLEGRRLPSSLAAVASSSVAISSLARSPGDGARPGDWTSYSAAERAQWLARISDPSRLNPARLKGLGEKDDTHSIAAGSSSPATSLGSSSSRDPSLVLPPATATPAPSSNSTTVDRADAQPAANDGGMIAMDENTAPSSDPSRNGPSSEVGSVGGAGGNPSLAVAFSTAISSPAKSATESVSTSGKEADGQACDSLTGSPAMSWSCQARPRARRRLDLLSTRGLSLLLERGALAVESARLREAGFGPESAREAGIAWLFDRGASVLSIDDFLDRLTGLDGDPGQGEWSAASLPGLVGFLIAGVATETARRRLRERRAGRARGKTSPFEPEGAYFPGLPGLPPIWGSSES